VLELHAIATKKMKESAEFAVAMTMRERHRFFGDSIFNDSSTFKLYTMWFDSINAEMSDCSKSEDRKSIHDGIRDSCGFIRLNKDVVGVMEEWFLGQQHLNAAIALEANDIQQYCSWKFLAAITVSMLGKPEDGMHMIDDLLKNDTVEYAFLQSQRGEVSGKCAYTNRVCSRFMTK
jgi:hypothetical protein